MVVLLILNPRCGKRHKPSTPVFFFLRQWWMPPIGGSVRFFQTNSGCSSGVHWFVLGAVVEPSMHVYL